MAQISLIFVLVIVGLFSIVYVASEQSENCTLKHLVVRSSAVRKITSCELSIY